MGASQSTAEQQQHQQPRAARDLNQQVIERLRSLEIQNRQRRQEDAASNPEKSYVIVPRADRESSWALDTEREL